MCSYWGLYSVNRRDIFAAARNHNSCCTAGLGNSNFRPWQVRERSPGCVRSCRAQRCSARNARHACALRAGAPIAASLSYGNAAPLALRFTRSPLSSAPEICGFAIAAMASPFGLECIALAKTDCSAPGSLPSKIISLPCHAKAHRNILHVFEAALRIRDARLSGIYFATLKEQRSLRYLKLCRARGAARRAFHREESASKAALF